MILLTADEHRQWQAAVDGWPICETCDGNGSVGAESADQYQGWNDCPDHCDRGLIPQPVYIVIEGELQPTAFSTTAPNAWMPPLPWRAVPVGEPCEIRAECPTCGGDGGAFDKPCQTCFEWSGRTEGSVLLATATVEVLPVEAWTAAHNYRCVRMVDDGAELMTADVRGYMIPHPLTLDPLPQPGRHFVAVVTP